MLTKRQKSRSKLKRWSYWIWVTIFNKDSQKWTLPNAINNEPGIEVNLKPRFPTPKRQTKWDLGTRIARFFYFSVAISINNLFLFSFCNSYRVTKNTSRTPAVEKSPGYHQWRHTRRLRRAGHYTLRTRSLLTIQIPTKGNRCTNTGC